MPAFWLALLLCLPGSEGAVCAWRLWAQPLPGHIGCALAYAALRPIYEPRSFRCLEKRPDMPVIERAVPGRWA
jgi:hypothetical protein